MLEAASARSARGRAQRPRLVEGRIEQLPFPDGSFDVVVIVTVLCLVADRADAVREAARILRPGGRLVIGDLGRWSARAARRRVKAWRGSQPTIAFPIQLALHASNRSVRLRAEHWGPTKSHMHFRHDCGV